MRGLKRLIVMAGLGAGGALLGAAGGESLFRGAPVEPPASGRRSICLVFDLSESMSKKTTEGRSQLATLREAARGFLATREFERDSLSLVGFSDEARVLSAPTSAAEVSASLDGLRAGGRTDIWSGLVAAQSVLSAAGEDERWILLFTDGKPQTGRLTDAAEEARLAARACRGAGVRIVCVGTGLAERTLLEDIAGDAEHVFVSRPEALGSAFERSVELIQSRQMLTSQPAPIDLEQSLRRACGWTALVALGTGLALVGGHNRHLRRRLRPSLAQLALVTLGAAGSGAVAGVAGQGTFYALSGGALLEPLLRTAAWILLGSGVVLGMSFFVPNLPRGRALVGGALGGAAAATAFLRIVPAIGDTPGRLLGALILGAMAGSMTVLVEASARRAWLVVRWPGGETSRLLLGAKPIVLGHSASAHICPVFDETRAPVVGLFTHGDGGIRFEDRRSGKTRRLREGERLAFDPIVVEVHGERASQAQPGRASAPVAAGRPDGRPPA